MAILLGVHELTHSFTHRPLFKGLTFSLDRGERIGLIGPNGVGKSTLLRILSGQMTADSGTVSRQKGLIVGYLEQDPKFSTEATVLSTVLEASKSPGDWEEQHRALELISRFDLDTLGAEAPVGTLSGGWRKRVALAREFMKNPDVVLLDEPTNHLDVPSIIWLEGIIRGTAAATLTVTHDRLFLQRVSERIIEVDPRYPEGLLSVAKDYASFLEIRSETLAAQTRREIILRNTLRRETEWLRRGAKARTTKQEARIQRAESLGEEVAELKIRNQTKTIGIEVTGVGRSPKKLVEAQNISKTYDGRPIFERFNLVIAPGSRIGLVGTNGCGKSTLIRVLLGHEKPDTGSVFLSDQLLVSYFDQSREALDQDKTVLETISPSGPSGGGRPSDNFGNIVDGSGRSVHVRSYLDRFLFTSSQMEMRVGRLSGGEQSRLLIARLLLRPANLLILDEPTNDLDAATLDVLAECLDDFTERQKGALILVTHDRYFLDQATDTILAFPPPGRGTEIASLVGLQQWESWYRGKQSGPSPQGTPPASLTPSALLKKAKPKGKLSFKEQQELKDMESKIADAESRLRHLNQEIADPKTAGSYQKLAEKTKKISETQAEIARLYNRWVELEAMK